MSVAVDRRAVIVALAALLAQGGPLRAQGALPVIGLLGSETPEQWKGRLAAFFEGLAEEGLREGRDFTVEARWARGSNDRLAGLAEELVRAKVAVIAILGSTTSATLAARTTKTIPIVVRIAFDPVAAGLVQSLGRPGGNVTGWTTLGGQMGPKQLELLKEVLPAGTAVGVLLNPTNPVIAERLRADVPPAAQALGFTAHVAEASSDAMLEPAFDALAASGVKAVVIGADTFFNSRNDRIAALARARGMAGVSAYREFALAGGFMSYGGSITDASFQVGRYAGRILKGEKPGELPVQQVARFELLLNAGAAAAIGLKLPLPLVARADEVID